MICCFVAAVASLQYPTAVLIGVVAAAWSLLHKRWAALKVFAGAIAGYGFVLLVMRYQTGFWDAFSKVQAHYDYRADVGHDAVAAVGEAFGARDRRGHREDVADEVRVRVGQLRGRWDVVAGHDQDVRRRAGRDVADREDRVVTVDLRRGDLAGNDPAEEAARVAARRPGASGFGAHQRAGFVLIRKPMVPTSPAMTYEM